MNDLVQRLEAAEEGSEELDIAICRAVFNYKPDDPLWHVMPYTTSLDAALSLVPEGVSQKWSWPLNRRPTITIWRSTGGQWKATHRRIVIALCIAALRARQASHG